jgi:DNA modification methylase
MAIRDITKLAQGVVILGSWPFELPGWQFPLIIADPSYGKIVNEAWDHRHDLTVNHAIEQLVHLRACQDVAIDGGACYWFGGAGKPGYRPYYKVIDNVEQHTSWRIAMPITWAKRRAYGVQHNYLFTREEILYLVKGDIKQPHMFDVPYTDEPCETRGYNPRYQTKRDKKRRSAVWSDTIFATELLRGKRGPCEKPQSLLKCLIKTHTKPGDWVLDLYSDTGAASLAARDLDRRFVAIEERAEPSAEWQNGYHHIVERLR